MAVLVWSDRDGVLGNSIRSGRRAALSAEEYRPEAEALDRKLDAVLDMAWHALTIISRRENGKARFDTLEQAWILGRAVHVSDILRHEAMQGEERILLWQALTAKAWYGIRHDVIRDPRWRDLIPSKSRKWQTKPNDINKFRYLEIGYWVREQPLRDVGEAFGWKFSNANDLYDRASLRSVVLLRTLLYWLRQQTPEVRDGLTTPISASKRHAIIAKALHKRFPAKGPGSALLPQHYPEDELRAIVCEVLDHARDAHFSFKAEGNA